MAASSTVAVPVNQLWQPRLHSAGCGTLGNAWRSAVSSSGTSAGSFQSKMSRRGENYLKQAEIHQSQRLL